ncbi:hypothetical protein KTT56_13920 [Pseudomonas viridiflava]|uniref:hypothetical protein n=1 Tax=Pseudomonas viridiflava TaxID=33069 RepID=UPI001C314BE0|nr:hypothetical protein [Pseudomonas viridiflava]QXG22928.1 hypothetical protein KTT56_13920 [Pseudomonas viridiflava]
MDFIDILKETLSKHIFEAEEGEFLRDHDSRFSGLRTIVKNKSSRLRAPLNVLAPRLYYIADHSFYCVELFKYKYYLLAKAMLNGLNDNNPLSLANNCRSLLEQVATLSYCMQTVDDSLKSLKDQGTLGKIDQILSKAEKILRRTYAGEGKKGDKKPETEAIHVSTAVKELDTKIEDALESYDFLCEFVHPNYGNNLLISTGELGKGKIGSRENSDETITRIAVIGASLLNFGKQTTGLSYPILTWHAHHLVELCFIRGAKITNVFASKKPLPEGDGKTKETAFYFKNARTSQEAMDLSYKFLLEIGHQIKPSDRVNGGPGKENEIMYIYDKWSTKKGDIWFKIPFYVGIH